MVRSLSGFILGVGIGVGIGMLFTPDSGETTREKLRLQTANYASGDNTLLGTVQAEIENQRQRFEEAIEVGRRVSAQREKELWAQLKLAPPEPQISTDHMAAADNSLLS